MSVARIVALVIGWFFTILGIVGFLAVGLGSGFFLGLATNALHNLVWLVTGLVGLYFGYYQAGRFSRTFDQVVGIVYAILTIAGFIAVGLGTGTLLGIVPLSLVNNILHLVTAVVALVAGYWPARMAMEREERMKRAA
ncbi:MAG: DUF4383 domain-containing protein [Actinobacteria bacterium]|nr:MAG: DUF4383 domain-containing protein [Actinomycetota bacterium]